MHWRSYLQFIVGYNYKRMNHIIFEVRPEKQQSDGYAQLDEDFFLQLHQTEIRYIKLKYGRKSKETQRELTQAIIDLVACYTDCIDYFGNFGDAAVVYFQAKIKEINKYFQFLNSQLAQSPPPRHGTVEVEYKKDLGSISDQTGPELLPEEEREVSVMGKEALNHNLMAYLQTQDITSHIKENMKQEQKIHTAIAKSLKKQDDQFLKRKKIRRNISKSRVFLSFSERNLDLSNSLEPSEYSDLILADMDALEADTPELLQALALRMSQMEIRNDREEEHFLEI